MFIEKLGETRGGNSGTGNSGTGNSGTDGTFPIDFGRIDSRRFDLNGELASGTLGCTQLAPPRRRKDGKRPVCPRISVPVFPGRRSQRTLPLGQAESYGYEANGNLSSKTDFNGKTTSYAYDPANRLLSKTPDASFNASPVTFTYTATGKRQTMTDPSGVTTYTYDPQTDRLMSKQTPFGTITYTYDAAGDVTEISSSNQNGAAMAYQYDKLNRLSSVLVAGQSPTVYGYDDVGNLAGYTYPNGVATTLQYDGLNRLTNLASQGGQGAVASYAYTLGAAGNRTAVTELSGRTVSYGYDNLYRLTSETVTNDLSGMNGAVGYLYDTVGNRQQMSSTLAAIAPGRWNYDANDRPTNDQNDADGNIVARAGIANAYDFENHLIQHGYMTFVYDGDGNRVAKTIGGVTTNYLVDMLNPTGYAQVLDELQSNTVARSYTWGLQLVSESQLVAVTAPANPWQTSWYGFDGHGSVRYLTSSTGAVTDTYDYDAFGNLINSTGSTLNNYLFAGEQFDPNLNLYYNRARYLDVQVGRFWGMDTYDGNPEEPLSLHRYLYTYADPVNNVDHCGYCLPSNTTWGNFIQRDIFEQYFEFSNGQGLNSPTIASLVAPSPAGYWGGLMPDLAAKNPYWGEFYEIKSIYSLAAAEAKVATYEYYLEKYDRQRTWVPGFTFVPNLFTPIDASTMAIVVNAGPGVIAYCVVNTRELLGMAGVLLLVAGMLGAAELPIPNLADQIAKLPALEPAVASAPSLIPGLALADTGLAGAYFY